MPKPAVPPGVPLGDGVEPTTDRATGFDARTEVQPQLSRELGLPDRFEVKRQLGAGAMGRVYEVHDRTLGRDVAVKVLANELARVPVVRDRLLKEAQAAARLKHPGIVQVFDLDPDGAFIVMELVRGESLQARLDREKKLPADEVRRIGRAVLGALEAAHAAGLVHRDVKPANVLLGADGTVKLADFGVVAMGDSRLTEPGTAVGTPAFMAPEQLRGLAVDGRADLYSLGVTLFEAATGTRLHDDRVRDPPSERVERATRDPALAVVLARALEERPSDRYANARAFSKALASKRVQLGDRRRLRVGAVLALLVVAGAGLGAWASMAVARSRHASAQVVAVLPFDDRLEDPELDFAREGLPALLGEELEHRGGYRVVDVWQLDTAPGQERSELALRASALKQGAELLVRGSLEPRGGKVRLRLRFEDAEGRQVRTVQRLTAPSDLPQVLREVAPELIEAAGRTVREGRPAEAASFSFEQALRRGIADLERHELPSAQVQLERAVALQPSSVDALYTLAIVLWWRDAPEGYTLSTLHAALAHPNLRPVQRAFLQGLQLFLDQRYPEALAHFEHEAVRFPDERDVLYGLFEAQFHGDRVEQSIVTYRAIGARWPRFRTGAFHAFEYYASKGDAEGMRWVQQRPGTPRDVPHQTWRIAAKSAVRDYAGAVREAEALLVQLGGSDNLLLEREVFRQTLLAGDVGRGAALLAPLQKKFGRLVAGESLGFAALTGDLADLGRLRAQALDEAQRASTDFERVAGLADVVLVELGTGNRATLAKLQQAVATGIGARVASQVSAQLLAAYLAGAAKDRAGLDAVAARANRREVKSVLEAFRAWDKGDVAAAEAAFARAQEASSDGKFSLVHAWFRAKVLAEAGRRADAARACEDVVQPRVFRWAWATMVAPCLEWTAQARAEARDAAGARAAWQRIIDLRVRAGAGDAWVASAQQGLAEAP